MKCKLPAGLLISKVAVDRYAKAFMVCLDKAWAPVVSRAGTTYAPPLLYAVQVGASTACGKFGGEDYLAYYCHDNGAIYFDWQEYADPSGEVSVEAEVELQVLMAHEHGHHLQQLLWITTSFSEDAVTAAELEESRRLEIQASCFGFAFLGANRTGLGLTGYRKFFLDDIDESGDEPGETRSHGSPRNNRVWSRAAFASRSPASCNTWAAPAAKVS
ncbi:neutral zinc metallopeptidase [Kribbella sp. CA-293567]|uniref:neutral zinc metallopeptidase n=1 Tax=Kribbella sp. CA-293567 TaxID=3002436 RepID=UPI0022DD9302|nr:neutral zinc metallopeptidase [Kribbella sp. CA-293567]WBQ04298.1 neutral zinc metallopeptidase [Kribbella sp. CA-293567]